MAFARKVITGTGVAILGAALAFGMPAQAAQYTLDAPVAFNTGGASPAIGTLLPIIDPVGARICLASCSNLGLSDFDPINDPLFFQPGGEFAGGRDFFIFQIDLTSGTLQSIGVAMQGLPPASFYHESLGYLLEPGQVPLGANTNASNPQFEFFAGVGGNQFIGPETSVRLFVTYAPGTLPPNGIPFLSIPADTVRFMINDTVGLVDFDGQIVVPEPATSAMIGLGLLALVGVYRRRS